MDNAQLPQPLIHPDDYIAAQPARQRLAKKNSFWDVVPWRQSRTTPLTHSPSPDHGPKKRRIWNNRGASNPQDGPSSSRPSIVVHDDEAERPHEINLRDDVVDEDEQRDEYRWAVVYENQRGATIFSIPYYSSLSLFPADPPAFTIPSAYPDPSKQPKISLTSFSLPDANWRWVSKTWMVDMRTGSGEVQHDGFEYNWSFRKGRWRSEVGYFSMGGFVRRRRWVRLMMRPGKARRALLESDQPSDITDGSVVGHDHPSWIAGILEGRSTTGSSVLSVSTHASEPLDEPPSTITDDVWQGSDTDQQWARCHALMNRVGRDGRKLELWQKWLGPCIANADSGRDKGKQRQEPRTGDSTPKSPGSLNSGDSTCSPSLDHIACVIRLHANCILRLFVFPESRAQFIKLLDRAGLLTHLPARLNIGLSTSEVDFWSYMNDSGTRPRESGSWNGPTPS